MYKEIQGKLCKGKNGCGLFKPFNEFNKDKSTKDGYNFICKTCQKTKWKHYYSTEEFVNKHRERCNNYQKTPEAKDNRKEWWDNYSSIPDNIKKVRNKHKEYGLNKKLKLIESRLLKGAKPGDVILYFIKFINKETKSVFFKIGLTELSIKERYKNPKYNNYIYEILNEFYFEREYCRALEQKLIHIHKERNLQYVFPENEKFVGYTECFIALDEDVIYESLNIGC